MPDDRGAGQIVTDIVPSEDCPKSQNEWGTHHDDWYEDEGCPWCGTTEPNLLVFGGEE